MDFFSNPSSWELVNLYRVVLEQLTAANLYGLAAKDNPEWDTEFDGEAMDITRLALRDAASVEDVDRIIRLVIEDAFGGDDRERELDSNAVAQVVFEEMRDYPERNAEETPATRFAARLRAAGIHHRIGSVRDGLVMFEIVVPGERWEVELGKPGTVEVEVFRSSGEILDERMIDDLFARHSDVD